MRESDVLRLLVMLGLRLLPSSQKKPRDDKEYLLTDQKKTPIRRRADSVLQNVRESRFSNRTHVSRTLNINASMASLAFSTYTMPFTLE